MSTTINLKKIKGLRVENGLTQEDIAKLIGISKHTYHNKEMGKTDFTVNEMLKISLILKSPMEIFFTK